MRHFTPYLCMLAAALAMAPAGATAQTARNIVAPINRTMKFRGHQVPVVARFGNTSAAALTAHAAKTVKKAKADVTETDDIIMEDFNKLSKGSFENPDTVALCDIYQYFGGDYQWDIDPQYTEQPGWTGTWAFQAGGALYLNDPIGYYGAFVNTPLGDYSGNITITLRVKNTSKYSTLLNINMLKGGYENLSYAKSDQGATSTSVTLNGNSGWKTITFKVHNLSSDNDGYLQLLAYGQCLIDYVHITRDDDFIAPPTILPETNFTDTSFTANWQKVDLAYDYRMWLYQRIEKGTEDRAWNTDFESGMGDGFTTNGKIEDGIGEDGSKALTLAQGDTLVTPYNLSTYKDMKFWMMVDGADEDELDEANATIQVDLLTMNGWKEFGDFYAVNWTTPETVDMQEASDGMFNNIYYGMRIIPKQLPEGARVIIDNIDIKAGKDGYLQPLGEDEEAGYYYDNTKKTSYTFDSDMTPGGEYYYGIQSHYAKLTSVKNLYRVFGVTTPKTQPATDIDSRGSYTANWTPSVLATGYRVENYGVTTAATTGMYDIIDEDFSGVNSDATSITDPSDPDIVGSDDYMSLDKYTKLPGWSASDLSLAQGYVGSYGEGENTGSIKTPTLYLDNDEKFRLTIKAVGEPDETLYIVTPNEKYALTFDENGVIDGSYSVPEHGSALTLRFYSTADFMIDNIKVSQNVNAGSNIYTWLESATVDGKDSASKTFDGLYNYDFDKFAYTVTALREEGANYTESDRSDFTVVDLMNGTSTGISISTRINNRAANGQTTVAGRYNIGGQRVNSLQRGVNIVKMSDGTVKKILVK